MDIAVAEADPPATLLGAMRARTQTLHVMAERSGFVRDLLRGVGSRQGYALLLRNLLPAYEALEAGLDRHRHRPVVAAVRQPSVYRSEALTADLVSLGGGDWHTGLPLLPAGRTYAARIAAVAAAHPDLLLAHAYVRYLGDINGGQILKRLLARTLQLDETTLAFLCFPQIADLERFKPTYLAAFEAAGAGISDIEPVVREAESAFQMNIDLSEAVHRAAPS